MILGIFLYKIGMNPNYIFSNKYNPTLQNVDILYF